MVAERLRQTAGSLAILAGGVRFGVYLWVIGRELAKGTVTAPLVVGLVLTLVYAGLGGLGGWWLVRGGDGPRLMWGIGFVTGIGALAAVRLIADILAAANLSSVAWTLPERWLLTVSELTAAAAGVLVLRLALADSAAVVQRPTAWLAPATRWSLVVAAIATGIASQATTWRPADAHFGPARGLFGLFAAPGWLQAVMVLSILTLGALGIAAAMVRSTHLGVAMGIVLTGYAIVSLVNDATSRILMADGAAVEPTPWLWIKIAGFVGLALTTGGLWSSELREISRENTSW